MKPGPPATVTRALNLNRGSASQCQGRSRSSTKAAQSRGRKPASRGAVTGPAAGPQGCRPGAVESRPGGAVSGAPSRARPEYAVPGPAPRGGRGPARRCRLRTVLGRSRPSPAAPFPEHRPGPGTARRRRPGAGRRPPGSVEARSVGAVPGLSSPVPAAPSPAAPSRALPGGAVPWLTLPGGSARRRRPGGATCQGAVEACQAWRAG